MDNKNIFGISKWVIAAIIGTCLLAYSPRQPIKTIGTQLLAITEYSSTTQAYTSTHAVDGKVLAKITVLFARIATTAAGAGVNFYVQGAINDPGVAGKWDRLATMTSGFALAESENVSGTEAAGSTVIEVASTTNLVANGFIYFDNGTTANSEWAEIKSVQGTPSITLKEAITNAQTSSVIYTQAQIMSVIVDVSLYNDIRVEIDGLAHTQSYAVQIFVSDVQ